MVRQIDVRQLADRLAAGAPTYLLDVRQSWEHELAALPGSQLIPLNLLAARATEVQPPEGALVVVYCHHGIRSLSGATLLERFGLTNVVSLAGGIDAWSNEIDPNFPHATNGPAMSELSHFDESGAARMVDTSAKSETLREARASGLVRMAPTTLTLIRDRALAKGDVLEVARLAGIMAAKRTGDLIPLCHPLPITSATVDFSFPEPDLLHISATVRVFGRTGVEMEALTAVSVAALTVYDMCKAVDRVMTIERVRLEEKSGGRSGTFRRDD